MAGEFPTIHAGGEERILNCLPSDPARMAMAPASLAPLVAVEYAEADFRPAWLKIKDQDGYGACVGHGSSRAVEFVRALSGIDGGSDAWQELSAWDLYARLCNGVDRGANILDALTMLSADGVALMKDVPYGTINPRRIPAAAAAERKHYRIEIGGKLSSFEDMKAAAARGSGISYSVHVGGNFNNLDADGVPGISRGFANHCVFAGGELKASRKWGLMLGSDNSWTTQWGLKGRFYVCDAVIQAQSYFEAWEVRAVAYDLDTVPVAK